MILELFKWIKLKLSRFLINLKQESDEINLLLVTCTVLITQNISHLEGQNYLSNN